VALVAAHNWLDTVLDQNPAVLFRDEDHSFEQLLLAERFGPGGRSNSHRSR